LNIQEHEQLTRFLQELALARVGLKDADAERLIQESCSRQPDAPYLLVQRSLLLEQVLKNIEAENSRLRKELEDARGTGGSFLNANAWGNSVAASSVPTTISNTVPPVAVPPLQSAPPQANSSSWGGSGMLGTVATTAAGVVAGSFLFQGIEHLMGNHGGGSGFPGGRNSSLMTDTSSANSVTNNADSSDDIASDFDSLLPSDGDLDSV